MKNILIDKNKKKEIVLLHITKHSDGTKMDGIYSLNTSCLLNARCQKRKAIKGSICEKCFAFAQLNRYTNMQDPLEINTQLLTSGIIKRDYLPLINQNIFRFESFGDLNNETQFINYLNICKKNKQTTFAIWTKNPDILEKVFNELGYKKPKNLIIVVSSLFLNKVFEIDPIKHWFIDKVFTVFTCDYALENNIKINCGNKQCNNCRICYSKNKVIYVNEILKSQANKYYKLLAEKESNK